MRKKRRSLLQQTSSGARSRCHPAMRKIKDEKDETEALADELEQQYETIHVPKDRRTLEEMEIPAPDVIPAGRPTAWEQTFL